MDELFTLTLLAIILISPPAVTAPDSARRSLGRFQCPSDHVTRGQRAVALDVNVTLNHFGTRICTSHNDVSHPVVGTVVTIHYDVTHNDVSHPVVGTVVTIHMSSVSQVCSVWAYVPSQGIVPCRRPAAAAVSRHGRCGASAALRMGRRGRVRRRRRRRKSGRADVLRHGASVSSPGGCRRFRVSPWWRRAKCRRWGSVSQIRLCRSQRLVLSSRTT